jgi:hypothetical protein
VQNSAAPTRTMRSGSAAGFSLILLAATHCEPLSSRRVRDAVKIA